MIKETLIGAIVLTVFLLGSLFVPGLVMLVLAVGFFVLFSFMIGCVISEMMGVRK